MKNKKIIIIIGAVLLVAVAATIGIIRYNNIKEYKSWLEATDEEFDKANFSDSLGGYVRNIEVKDGAGYFIGIKGIMYNQEDYVSMSEMKSFDYDTTAGETGEFDVYYYSLYEVESFPVGICIENSRGDILFAGVTDINNREAIGQIHMEAGQNYHSKIYYLLDENTVNAFVKHTKTGVSVDGYPKYENKRWDFVEMFGVKKK
ncbi:MAG: hypothetical protein J6A59_17520 [Lachnospiraceae bacterium]|nr:hypothetical protein [Lachnospiraceae bacterium]